jgi:leucyl aminopeptidase
MKINFLNSIDNLDSKNSNIKNSSKTSLKKQSNNSVNIHIISKEIFLKDGDKIFKNYLNSKIFEAKFLQSFSFITDEALAIAIGSGEENKIDNILLNKIGAKIFSLANAQKYDFANIFIHQKLNPQQQSQIAFGTLLQSYRFNKYFNNKKKDKELSIQNINFISKDSKLIEKDFEKHHILANNIFMVRDLVSEPSNILNPETYAKFCQEIKVKGLEIEVLGAKDMSKLGMNSLLGVGMGSIKESKMVVLKWNGGKKNDKPVAFVGKGVTFDTGGISIKPANNMEDMKTDMAGSAVVVGLLKNLAERQAKINAIGVIGLVENMPSGSAQRPGDVVVSMSGQTIEVINTDAEGRLVLADVLHYVNTKYNPKFIVDLATLTGAIIVALADVYAGLFSNDDELAKSLQECGYKTAERVWRMPIGEEYDEMINSDIADMKNVGSGRGAGSITAAQFLHRFVGKTKWAHLDIAGVAWKGKGDALAHKGATGFGVRLLDELVKKYEN